MNFQQEAAMIKGIFVLASNTFKEIVRDRILYGFFVVALFVIGVSFALAELSFGERFKITMDFGLAAIHLSIVIISIFVGSTLVSREIEKKTVMTLLTRPLRLRDFILGKFLGLFLIILLTVISLSLILYIVLFFFVAPPLPLFLLGVYGSVLESLVLLSFVMALSCLSKTFVAISFSAGFFLIAHSTEQLYYFAQKAGVPMIKNIFLAIYYLVPNLERFNWRGVGVYGMGSFTIIDVGAATVYAALWSAIFLFIAIYVLGKRDIV